MNPFEVFSTEEIKKVNSVITKLENKDYTKDELKRLQNSIFEGILSNSSKNGDINKARTDLDNVLNKIESHI